MTPFATVFILKMLAPLMKFMLIVMKKFLLISLSLLLFSSILFAQTPINSNIERFRFGVPNLPENCEINSAQIYGLVDLFKSDSNPKRVFILIARLGKGETRRDLNQRRLYNVTKRLSILKERVVIAEGERVNSYGRVEIYWGGEIIGAILARKNHDVCVDCCGPDERYYPDKEDFDRKQKRERKRRNKKLLFNECVINAC